MPVIIWHRSKAASPRRLLWTKYCIRCPIQSRYDTKHCMHLAEPNMLLEVGQCAEELMLCQPIHTRDTRTAKPVKEMSILCSGTTSRTSCGWNLRWRISCSMMRSTRTASTLSDWPTAITTSVCDHFEVPNDRGLAFKCNIATVQRP